MNDQECKADTLFKIQRELMGLDCKTCNNRGWIYYEKENGYAYVKECECMTIYKNKLRIKNSGLEKLFNQCTFDNYKTSEKWQKIIKNTALEFINSANKWFYIGGAVGGGKTHICTAICSELIKINPIHYMAWRDEIVSLKANVTDDDEYQKLIYRLKTIEVLYIDDFFKGSITAADKNIAFEILNYRYNNKLITIISSEYDINNIIEMDEATGSRIYQMAKDFCLNIPKDAGKNYRLT